MASGKLTDKTRPTSIFVGGSKTSARRESGWSQLHKPDLGTAISSKATDDTTSLNVSTGHGIRRT